MKKRGLCVDNRGSLLGQPLVFVLIIIIIVFTLVFGFRVINNLKGMQEQVKYVEFKQDFNDAVDSVYKSNVGSVIVFGAKSRIPLIIPKGIKEVCFKDDEVYFEYYKNTDKRFSSFNVDNLNGNECIDVVSGGLSFKLENYVYEGEVYVLVSNE